MQNLAGVNRLDYNLLHTSWLAKRGCSAYTKSSSFALIGPCSLVPTGPRSR
jgi:hypothetical protein